MTAPIPTARLTLIAASAELLTAELAGREVLAQALAVSVPENWPPEFFDRDAAEWMLNWTLETPDGVGWGVWYLVETVSNTLAGTIGFKGKPLDDGTVEIGYSVLPQFQRRGYASEAAAALIERAFADASVGRVIAETYPELVASQRVMEKNGLSLLGPGSEEGVIRYELTREQWEHRNR